MASHGSIFGWVTKPTRHRCWSNKEPHTIAPVRWRENTAPLQQKQARMGFARDGGGFFKKQFPQLSGKIRPNDQYCLTIYFQVGSLSWGGERKGYPAILESAWNWPKGIWIRIFVGLRKLWSLNSPMRLETFLSFCVWNQKTQIPQPNIHPKSHEIFFWQGRYDIQL